METTRVIVSKCGRMSGKGGSLDPLTRDMSFCHLLLLAKNCQTFASRGLESCVTGEKDWSIRDDSDTSKRVLVEGNRARVDH